VRSRHLRWLAVGLVGLPLACSTGPAEDEQAVCDSLQTMVDHLSTGESLAAVTTMYGLDEAVAATSNSTLASAGADFFQAISQPVDIGSLTPQESVALGDQVLADAEPALATMLGACTELGLEVQIDLEALKRNSYRPEAATGS